MDDIKTTKLKVLEDSMLDIACFLYNYLPLANAHMTDFIVNDWWNKLVPQPIRDDLLKLSANELSQLPSGGIYSLDGIVHNRMVPVGNLILCGAPEDVLSRKITPRWDEEALPEWRHESLEAFIQSCKLRTLPNLGIQKECLDILPSEAEVPQVKEFMSIKKQHEVEIMTELCAALAGKHHLKYMVDVGSGKGYLSTHLVLRHDLRVLGVDSSCSNTEGATDRAGRLGKQWNGLVSRSQKKEGKHSSQSPEVKDPSDGKNRDSVADGGSRWGRFVAITQYVDTQTDIQQLLRQHLSTEHVDTKRDVQSPAATTDIVHDDGDHDVPMQNTSYMLGGLHACGDLTPSTLRLYVDKCHAKVLCNVGCCYQHLTEAYITSPYDNTVRAPSPGFPLSDALLSRGCQLGRNARMLASQAPARSADRAKSPSVSLYWRALLQVILRDITGEVRDDWCVGRIAAKCTDFPQYLHKALHKLGFSQQASTIDVGHYETSYRQYGEYIQCFVQLKSALAGCIESLILLDRATYLLQQADVCAVDIVQAFCPVISPRCYALIATKS